MDNLERGHVEHVEKGLRREGAGMTSYRDAMQRDGYVVVPGVLSTREVGQVRTMVSKFCEAGRGTYYENESKANQNVFAHEPEEFTMLLRHQGIAQAMKSIVGPQVKYLHELGISIGGSSGWHKDTHGLARSVRGVHDAYGIYKILIYPQDHIGLEEDDFALRVRKGSHFIPDPKEGEIDTIYLRAGDLIIIDVRTSHRGREATTEGENMLARALYYPFNHGAPGLTWELRHKLSRAMGRRERQLVTLLYGKPNEFSEEYMREGRARRKKKYPYLDVDQPLPATWRSALDSVGIAY